MFDVSEMAIGQFFRVYVSALAVAFFVGLFSFI